MSGQWVCLTCGYNMIGDAPDVCPFCGASHDEFVSWEEGEQTYRVMPRRVSDRVQQLLSVPKLGLEHAAYRIETNTNAAWVDCPSVFNRTLDPVSAIYFTHQDFLGASNQYRELWGAQVHLHALEAARPLALDFPVDHEFTADFTDGDIRAYHIGGHSPGFTMYVFDDVLFACDYIFSPDSNMCFNTFSDQAEIRKQATRVLEIVDESTLQTVCGYNYVAAYDTWISAFRTLSSQ